MQYLKILTYVTVLLIPAFQLLRDWKFSDKRTKEYHQFTRVLLIIWIIISLISAAFYFNDISDAKKEASNLRDEIGAIRKSNEELVKNNSILTEKMDSLINLNHELQTDKPYEQFFETLYPGLEKQDALEKLKKDFYDFKKKAEIEGNTIRKLEANLNVTFSGEWSSPFSRMVPLSLGQPIPWFLTISSSSDGMKNPIKLFPKEKFRFEDLDSDSASFTIRLEIMKGQYPLGIPIDELSKFSRIRMFIPTFFNHDKIKNQEIFIDEINVVFFVNDKECIPFSYNPPKPYRVPIDAKGWAIFDYKTRGFY